MTVLPPHVQKVVDELIACAPPLTPHQERVIQRNLGPAAMTAAQAAPHAA